MNWKAVKKTTVAWLIGIGIVGIVIINIVKWPEVFFGILVVSLVLFSLFILITITYEHYDNDK